MTQAASRAGNWWSGAGSNCRPSAFRWNLTVACCRWTSP